MDKRIKMGARLFVLLFLLIVLGAVGYLQFHYGRENWRGAEVDRGVYGKNGMVVSAHFLASEIGRDILRAGGNAFDAAIAVNYALAVVYPRAGNIGGGGFLVYRLADGTAGTLDFREKAPLAAHRDMYLDAQGNVIKDMSRVGARAVGVPGTVAGMSAIWARFASLPRAQLLAPAIALAENGFPLTEKGARNLNRYADIFAKVNRFQTALQNPQGWQAGALFKQPAQARTLRAIAAGGRDGFYKGWVARALIAEMQASDGLITQADLDAYQAVWRKPIRFNYRGHGVISMPPPSSGGVALAQLLIGAEKYNLAAMGANSAAHIHIMTELARRVYADRATWLGDPDFVDVPVARLTAPDYIAARNASIDRQRKTPSSEIRPGHVNAIESVETTHFSIVDSAGNAVALTTTLNSNFGSKLVVQDGGFLLNNEMDDFSVKPGVANQFGLLGDSANAIAPQKRMLSSMTPTIVEKDGKLFMVLGTPGGATIITSVFQTLLNVIDFGMSAQEAVHARKAHHQWQPDLILLERGTPHLLSYLGLKRRGHRLRMWPQFSYELGRVEAILVHADGQLEGAADWRRGFDDRAVGY